MFTGLLIAVLILAGAATAVGGGLALAKRRKSLPSGGDSPKLLTDGSSGERGLEEPRVGDVFTYDGHDYLVEGVLAYDEDGHKWNGVRVTDGKNESWMVLGVERVGDLTVRLVNIDPEMEITGYPPETLIAGGTRYSLDKRGTASAKFSGEVGRIPGATAQKPGTVERCRWWLYNSTGDETLLLEQWGGEYRALRGNTIHPGLIEMMPGS
jgi:hypothetical protein